LRKKRWPYRRSTIPISAPFTTPGARAYELAGDTGKARKAFQDFFTLWKDADQDLPILKQAQAEYARLKE